MKNQNRKVALDFQLSSLILLTIALMILFPAFLWCQDSNPKENYEKKLLFDLKIDKSLVDSLYVDANENYYVLHSKNPIIEIFDKTGTFVKKISWNNPYPNTRYRINVDEDGNILLCGVGQTGVPAFILDKEGKLITSFKIFELFEYAFFNGIVYQVTDGKVLYKLPSAKASPKQNMFYKDFDEKYDLEMGRKEALKELQDHKYMPPPKQFKHLPKKVGEFLYDGMWAVTNDGTSFAFYDTRPVIKPGYNKLNPYQLRELLKFDPGYHLIGVIPTPGWPFVNLENGKLYEDKTDYQDGIEKIYRWDKVN